MKKQTLARDPLLKADGFDKAVIGIGRRCGKPDLIVYDYDKCVKILMKRDGMTEEEAVEFLEFNTVGSWVGETTPIYVTRMTMEEIDELADEIAEEERNG